MSIDPNSSHYDKGGIEVFKVLRAKLTSEQYEGFLLGNIMKYAMRSNWKGQKTSDARKIRVYSKLFEELQAEESQV